MSRTLWVLFALFIVYGTTIPFNFSQDPEFVRQKFVSMPWNPFSRPDGRRLSIPDAVQNVMLFVPFGVLGGLACRRRFGSRAALVVVVTASGAALSAAVETLQLLTTDRVSATSDVMTNGLGAFAGVLVAEAGRQYTSDLLRARGSSPWLRGRWSYAALCAMGVLLVAAWQPFDLTLDVSTVGSKIRGLLRSPWQRGPWTDEGNSVVLYALATIVLACWFRGTGIAMAELKAAGAGAALAVGLELSQMLVSSRTPAGSDAAVRLFGVVLGTALLPVIRASGRRLPWLVLLFAACVASAAIATWGPFVVTEERQAFSWFPFLGYYDNNWFPAVSHLIEIMLIYFPFGFALGMARLSRSAVRAALAAVLVAAIGIEYGQSWFVGRHADVTDVGFSALGGWLGAWVSVRGAELFERARASAVG